LGIKVPQQYDSIEEAVFPYVIKPTNLSSAKGVLYIRDVKDLPGKISDDLIIQQYIRGTGVGYSFYCKNGKILNGYGHKRLAEYPVTGGSSTYREGYQNREMVEIASQIVSHLKYTGFAMFEYKLTPQNEIYLIEVNPRIWGSVNQGLENGVNYFEEMFGKSEVPLPKRKRERKTYLSPLVYRSLWQYLLKSEGGPLLYFIKNTGNNIPDVSFISDPKGYCSLLLRKLL
jgi:predicted ATP-grasp superfamily ATP-dependent carboligase